MKVSHNVICLIMALNSDIRCLYLSNKINKNQHVFWINIPNKQTLFILACQNNKLDIVKILLPHVDPSANNNYAIRLASLYCYTEVVKLLLKSGKNKRFS